MSDVKTLPMARANLDAKAAIQRQAKDHRFDTSYVLTISSDRLVQKNCSQDAGTQFNSELQQLGNNINALKQEISSLGRKIDELKTTDAALNNQLKAVGDSVDTLSAHFNQKQLDFLADFEKVLEDTREEVRKESPYAAITSPGGTAVLIVLILVIAVIALTKGFSVSKGDVKVSVGKKD